MVPSPIDLAKKRKNAQLRPRNNSGKTTLYHYKMKRIIGPGSSTAAGAESGESSRTAASVSHGVVSVIGRKRAMDDAVAAVQGMEIGGVEYYFDFFAVYEGRRFGSALSVSCKNQMHLLVAKEAEKKKKRIVGIEIWKEVMVNSFLEMDREIRLVQQPEYDADDDVEEEEDAEAEKSTAAVVMVGKEEIVVANSGDCKAVLSRGGAALPLSGGRGDRADSAEDGRRVMSVPEVTMTERSESDEFLVIASEGMWDVISSDAACAFVGKCFNGGGSMGFADDTSENCEAGAAAFLAELAMARGSRENISVIVVKL
ncbi:Probable protein phosphatase 2C 8 [Linum perenne]